MAEPLADGRPGVAPDRTFLIVASLAGMAVTALACLVLHVLSLNGTYGQLSDSLFITPYWSDAAFIHAGYVPYRDFALEYPPLSLPVFVLPSILPGGGLDYPRYRTMFEVLMSLCAMGLVPIAAATIARLGSRRGDVILGVALVAATPLLFGTLTISRYDLWPALLTAGATLAAVSGRHRIGFALLALGALAKVYPIFLGPAFALYAWRTRGVREAVVATSVGVAVGVLGLAPFLAVDAAGALDPFARSLARPLQVESLGASVLAGLHDWLGLRVGPVTYGFESYNLGGPWSSEVATIQLFALVMSVTVVWLLSARRSRTFGDGSGDAARERARFVVASAAVLAATVTFGKVLSPQYVLWVVPAVVVLVPVVRAGPLLWLGAILVLTQLYFPGMYLRYLTAFDAGPTLTILERNLALLVLAAYLVALTWRLDRPRRPRLDPPADRAPAAA